MLLTVDESDAVKMVITNNTVHSNENKIPYYNANYDDPEYLESNTSSTPISKINVSSIVKQLSTSKKLYPWQ